MEGDRGRSADVRKCKSEGFASSKCYLRVQAVLEFICGHEVKQSTHNEYEEDMYFVTNTYSRW